MKNLFKLLGNIYFQMFLIFITTCIFVGISSIKDKIEESEIQEEIVKRDTIISHVVTATIYNPVAKQCDSSPLITADRSVIDTVKLNNGELKWIAVSRELRQYYKYGSKVKLTCESNPEINGIYEVHDTMNSRYTNYIDILQPTKIKYGKWKNVIIEKI